MLWNQPVQSSLVLLCVREASPPLLHCHFTVTVRSGVPNVSFMAVARAEMLESLVAHVVAVKDVRLIRDKFTGQPRGFGFMEFHSVQDAARALQLLQVQHAHNT